MQDAKWSGYSSTRALPLQSLHHYVWTVWGVAPEEPTAAIPHGGVCEEREGQPSRLLGRAVMGRKMPKCALGAANYSEH